MSDTKTPAREVDDSIDALSRPALSRKANEFLEQDDLSSAYPYLTKLAETVDDSPQPSVVAGLTAVKLERQDEAVAFFERALTIAPDHYDAMYNLALVEMARGEAESALIRLRRLAKEHPGDAGLQNDLAVLWWNNRRPARAEAGFNRALRIDPNFSRARNNAMEFFLDSGRLDGGHRFLSQQEERTELSDVSRAEINRWKSVLTEGVQGGPNEQDESTDSTIKSPTDQATAIGRIAVFASQRTFIQDVVTMLSKDNEVRFFEGKTVRDISELLAWADVAWFEWCDNLVIQASRLPKTCPIICRLHSYEAFTDMPGQVDWSKIDHLVFVNESVRELVSRQVPASVQSSVIFNGVDLSRFDIPQHKRYGKKIASVGYINYKKNPSLLLYAFKKIHDYDPEYSLHIAGAHQDARIALYFDHFLKQNPLPVKFHGWVEDIPAFFEDMAFVMSTSLFESFHYSIAEGMASGVIPLIHDWYGARNLYPQDYLYIDPDECVKLVRKLERSNRYRLAQENREWVAQRYDLADRNEDIIRLLQSITIEQTEPEEVR